MEKVTLLIIDDHTLVREMWSFILNSSPDFQVVGEAENAEQGLMLVKFLHPCVVVMDINLPGMNGIEATKQIQKLSPSTKVLGVSMHNQPWYAKKMMQGGAWGYVTKNSSREEMFTAIGEIVKGNRYICQEIKEILSEQLINGQIDKTGTSDLSRREIEIISSIRQGHSSNEIAVALSISVKTVDVHRYNIIKKLNLKNKAAFVNFINTNAIKLVTI
jgi:two-component system invasion response regulator UvrY